MTNARYQVVAFELVQRGSSAAIPNGLVLAETATAEAARAEKDRLKWVNRRPDENGDRFADFAVRRIH